MVEKRVGLALLGALALAVAGCGLIPVGGFFHTGAHTHRFATKPPALVVARPSAGPWLRELQAFSNEVRVGELADLREGEVFLEVHSSQGIVGMAACTVYDIVFIVPALLVALPPLLDYDSCELTVKATDASGRVGVGRSSDAILGMGTVLSPLLLIDMPDTFRAKPDVLVALKAALAELESAAATSANPSERR